MHNQDFFFQAFVFLAAAVISVPIAKRLGLGSVLGYLLAGVAIGPFALGFIGSEDNDIMHFAEFGVVMMLFLIGLELRPRLLWSMRRSIFGLGGLQVLGTTILITAGALILKLPINQAVSVGLILALSSTAIVLQSLAEKNLLKTSAGQSVFSVLLFQDIAVIPILAILPLLAGSKEASQVSHEAQQHAHETSEILAQSGWLQLLIIIGLVLGIIFVGRFASRFLFRIIASTGIREIFTATALFIVIAIALAMEKVGLSAALGTFIAGVVLADSEYRHELESDIEPFKGLLLGLFFIAVGASIDFSLLVDKLGLVLALVGGLVGIKLIVLLALGRLFNLRKGKQMLLAFSLAQGGEFAFVLISFSQQNHLFPELTASILMLTVALSMMITPLLLIVNEKIIQPAFSKAENDSEPDKIEQEDAPVIIAGFGRYGLTVGRLLLANGIGATVLDNDPKNIQILRKFNMKVYYGDASRPELLHAAGANEAKTLVIAVDDKDKALEIAEYAKHHYPHLEIFARAIDLKHLYLFYKKGITNVKTEVFGSALETGIEVMQSLGCNKHLSYRIAQTFKKHNKAVLYDMYQHWLGDKNKYIKEAQRYTQELEELLRTEREGAIPETDSAWDVVTLKKEVEEMANNEKK